LDLSLPTHSERNATATASTARVADRSDASVADKCATADKRREGAKREREERDRDREKSGTLSRCRWIAQGPANACLFVAGLSAECDEAALADLFGALAIRGVVKCKLRKDKSDRRYAFVQL
jgi:hypothetical protein